jgi:hypothetical protein
LSIFVCKDPVSVSWGDSQYSLHLSKRDFEEFVHRDLATYIYAQHRESSYNSKIEYSPRLYNLAFCSYIDIKYSEGKTKDENE